MTPVHRLLAVFISALLVTAAKADMVPISPGIVNPMTGSTYYLLPSASWTEAEAAAVGLGGHLVTVNDVQEQTWIVTTFSNYGGLGRFLWIGLNDQANDGTWLWSSGEASDYRNWWTWEPNFLTPEEDFVQMFGTENNQGIPAGYWNDAPDSAWPYMNAASGHNFGPVYGVAEIAPVPEPAEGGLIAAALCGLLIGVQHLKRSMRNRRV